jgi:hypothetical protein
MGEVKRKRDGVLSGRCKKCRDAENAGMAQGKLYKNKNKNKNILLDR